MVREYRSVSGVFEDTQRRDTHDDFSILEAPFFLHKRARHSGRFSNICLAARPC